MAKRLMDIFLALIGIVTALPFLPIMALLIKLDSRGPVFYLAPRVGKDMKNFKMYKFRTMIDTPISVGDCLSPQHDPRVTAFGRFLRRTKLNELPQLINILKGDMTFVGPRPEAPDLAELYPEDAKEIFSVTPGLVGPNDLAYFSEDILGRNEEELYPPGVDAKKYYIEKILPKKIQVDLEYLKSQRFLKDLKYIFLGVIETLIGALSKKHIQNNRSQIYLITADMFLSQFSYILAYTIYFWDLPVGENLFNFLIYFLAVIGIRLLCNSYFGMYNSLIRFISYHDILRVLKGVTCGSILLALFALLCGFNHYSIVVSVIDWACLIFFLSCLRFGLRFYLEKRCQKSETRKKHRVLIFGANEAGRLAYRALVFKKNGPFEVVGFIDDAPEKYGKTLLGLRVLGNRFHIKTLAKLYEVEEIVLAIPDAQPDEVNNIIEICQEEGLKCPLFYSDNYVGLVNRYTLPFRRLEFSDLLQLPKVRMNNATLKQILADKTVLVNGSGGALGEELCQQILQVGCKKLILIERYESYLAELVATLFNLFPKELIVPAIVDTNKIDALDQMFENYRPDVVFHVSMRKYTPFLRTDFDGVAESNYVRTFNLAKVTKKYKSEVFVMISSVTGTNGANFVTESLRITELSLKHFFTDTNTRLAVARIPNIVENRGGIVSVIENQIRKQRIVSLPSAKAKTCLISKDSAAEFILQTLVDAIKMPVGEGLFASEPGTPVSFIEVARKIANLYGLKLGADVAIKFDGLSRGQAALAPEEAPSFACAYNNGKLLKKDCSVSSDEIKSAFRKFVFGNSADLSVEDWKIQTRKLIDLYGPSIFVSE